MASTLRHSSSAHTISPTGKTQRERGHVSRAITLHQEQMNINAHYIWTQNVVTLREQIIIFFEKTVFWDVTACGSCKTGVSEEHSLHHQGEKFSNLGKPLAVTSNYDTLWRNTDCMRSETIEWYTKGREGGGGRRFLLRPTGCHQDDSASNVFSL
jgi:hypothetical protein